MPGLSTSLNFLMFLSSCIPTFLRSTCTFLSWKVFPRNKNQIFAWEVYILGIDPCNYTIESAIFLMNTYNSWKVSLKILPPTPLHHPGPAGHSPVGQLRAPRVERNRSSFRIQFRHRFWNGFFIDFGSILNDCWDDLFHISNIQFSLIFGTYFL